MFYNHENMAWQRLMATLGPRSALKKVNRKAILEVNVPRACETILAPDAPLALRLQSNLLYGVSRVYSQQCGYVLVDVQAASNHLRALLKTTRDAELDPEAGKARPDQLILQDDPAFLPEYALPRFDLDLVALDLSSGASNYSSILSSSSHPSSRSSHAHLGPTTVGLEIPSSDVGGVNDFEDFAFPATRGSSIQRGGRDDLAPLSDAVGGDDFLPDVDFEFDVEGNVRDLFPTERLTGRSGLESASISMNRPQSQDQTVAHLQRLQRNPSLSENFDCLTNDYQLPGRSSAEPGLPATHASGSSWFEVKEHESSEVALAPNERKRKAAKVFELDVQTELPSTQLTTWNRSYLNNMSAVVTKRQSSGGASQAKKNADFWIYRIGLGNVGVTTNPTSDSVLRGFYSGEALLNHFGHAPPASASRKRKLKSEMDERADGGGRNVRAREDSDEHVPGIEEEEDEIMLPLLQDDGLEVGREAPPDLPDRSSAMPWNVSGSLQEARQGSSLIRGRGVALSGFAGVSSSAGKSSMQREMERGLLSRRRSRILSASPLVGRSRFSNIERLSTLEIPNLEGDDFSLGGFDSDPPVGAMDEPLAFSLAEPSHLSTPAMAPFYSSRLALNRESFHFLQFLKANLTHGPSDEASDRGDGASSDGENEPPLSSDEGPSSKGDVVFDELFRPATTSGAVAAQALYQTLVLATKNLVQLAQDGEWGPITITPLPGP
ncbi:MAG: hypothetical protein M1838_005022 [Thelocarpon superellum]|nr:MAG: hypothetical protein M1838_005022 [Thelocarpon superellum]